MEREHARCPRTAEIEPSAGQSRGRSTRVLVRCVFGGVRADSAARRPLAVPHEHHHTHPRNQPRSTERSCQAQKSPRGNTEILLLHRRSWQGKMASPSVKSGENQDRGVREMTRHGADVAQRCRALHSPVACWLVTEENLPRYVCDRGYLGAAR
jgi:hypothetical protein